MLRDLRFVLLAATSVVALSAGAQAATQQIYGGGSSLAAPTYTQEFAILKGIDSSVNFNYSAIDSVGLTAFLTNNPTLDGFAAGTPITFGASESAVTSAQVSTFQTTYGYPLIQLPAFGAPITVPFVDGTAAAVTLTDNDLCGIYSGKITDWGRTSAAGTVPPGAITVVFRGDKSGTSFLLTNHLATACTTGSGGNSNIAFTATTDFASNFPGSLAPANFVPGTGSGGEQAQLLLVKKGPVPVRLTGESDGHSYSVFAITAIGYLGPDYTSIAPKSTNSSTLPVAALKNAISGKIYLPTIAATAVALGTKVPAPNTKVLAANPLNWVPLFPQPADGYLIAGYTNLLFSQCYKVAKVQSGLTEFLRDQYNNANFAAAINNNGFVTVPNSGVADFVTAINADFLSNTSGYNLNFGNSTACAGRTGR